MKTFDKFLNEDYQFKVKHSNIKQTFQKAFNELSDGDIIFWGSVVNNRSYPYMSFKAFSFANKWEEDDKGKYAFYVYNDSGQKEKFYSLTVPSIELEDSSYEKKKGGNIHILSTSIYDVIDFFKKYRNNYPSTLKSWLIKNKQSHLIKENYQFKVKHNDISKK